MDIKNSQKAIRFSAKVCRKLKMTNLQRKLNNKYHSSVFKLLESNYGYVIDKHLNKDFKVNEKNSPIIWVSWWQGFDEAPDIVKTCIQSIMDNAGKAEVHIIDKYNYANYVNLPQFIMDKFQNGEISFAHFSDILRMNLLRIHGGVWIDSTIFVYNKLDYSIFEKPLFTRKTLSNEGYSNPSDRKWSAFLFGGSQGAPFLDFICDLFNEYWKNNFELFDYFFVDYAIALAYKHNIGKFRDISDAQLLNEPNIYKLVENLSTPFSGSLWSEITSNTNFFKLTYKESFKDLNNNQPTFYSKLINKELVNYNKY